MFCEFSVNHWINSNLLVPNIHKGLRLLLKSTVIKCIDKDAEDVAPRQEEKGTISKEGDAWI